MCVCLAVQALALLLSAAVRLPHLGFVPLLCLLHVLGGNALILGPDVPEGTGQVRPGGIHFRLHLHALHAHLDILDFLTRAEGRVESQQAKNLKIIYQFGKEGDRETRGLWVKLPMRLVPCLQLCAT